MFAAAWVRELLPSVLLKVRAGATALVAFGFESIPISSSPHSLFNLDRTFGAYRLSCSQQWPTRVNLL